ncbi:MAG: phosphatidate cytidylyltransferase [Lentisphaerae bacterium]|nr:phosphatidate cytidylyltransferase [Lentisphaerota bacterium]
MSIEISYFEEIKRKGVHLSSLWMVAATLLLPRYFAYGRWISCILFAALLLLTLVSEHDYANGGKYLGKLYGILFGRMLRKEVKPGMWIVSGGAFVLAAALLVNLLFVPHIAAPALAVMLTGDAAAALIGRKFGRHKAPNGKSWEGVLAFVLVGYGMLSLVTFLANAPEIYYLTGIFAVIFAAFAELFEKQIKLDDNFSIPLCVGAVLFLSDKFF